MTTTEIPVRLDFDSAVPAFSRAMSHLDNAATKELDRVGIDPALRELVRIRASQLNGCAYCIDMHSKDARKGGESEQRLYGVAAWRETPYFTDRERAALASPSRSPWSRTRTCRPRTTPRWPSTSRRTRSARWCR